MQEHRNYTSSLTKGEVRFVKNNIIIRYKSKKVNKFSDVE